MGNWYRVTKKINGRLYDYWQRTYRVGKSVKTENKYIGPARSNNNRTFAPVRVPTISPSTVSSTAPVVPEEALHQLTPFTTHLAGKDRHDYEKQREKDRREDERIQYGNLKDRIKRHAVKYRAAKRKTKGIKSLNPFLAQALLKRK